PPAHTRSDPAHHEPAADPVTCSPGRCPFHPRRSCPINTIIAGHRGTYHQPTPRVARSTRGFGSDTLTSHSSRSLAHFTEDGAPAASGKPCPECICLMDLAGPSAAFGYGTSCAGASVTGNGRSTSTWSPACTTAVSW